MCLPACSSCLCCAARCAGGGRGEKQLGCCEGSHTGAQRGCRLRSLTPKALRPAVPRGAGQDRCAGGAHLRLQLHSAGDSGAALGQQSPTARWHALDAPASRAAGGRCRGRALPASLRAPIAAGCPLQAEEEAPAYDGVTFSKNANLGRCVCHRGGSMRALCRVTGPRPTCCQPTATCCAARASSFPPHHLQVDQLRQPAGHVRRERVQRPAAPCSRGGRRW